MKSEAQAYQAIRREWKRKRNSAQREQTFLMWQVNHKEVHPSVCQFVAKVVNMPVQEVHIAINNSALAGAYKKQREASAYQQLLNNYKVDRHDS